MFLEQEGHAFRIISKAPPIGLLYRSIQLAGWAATNSGGMVSGSYKSANEHSGYKARASSTPTTAKACRQMLQQQYEDFLTLLADGLGNL